MTSSWTARIAESEEYLLTHCPLYESNWVSHILIPFRHLPTLVSIVLIMAQYYEPFRDVYYPIAISSGTLFSLLINFLLQTWIDMPGASATCGSSREMPPFSVQQAGFIVAMLVTFGTFWKSRIGTYQQQFMYLLFGMTAGARYYLGYNTRAQVLTGAAIGTGFAILWQTMVYNFLCLSAKYQHEIFNVWLFKKLRYTNNWCMETWTPVARATEAEMDSFLETLRSGWLSFLNLPALLVPPAPDLPNRRKGDIERPSDGTRY